MRLRRFLPLLALSFVGATASPPTPPCPRVASIPLTLPAVHAAMMRGEPLVIVAFGSSSTRGAGASDPSRSYPAVLQASLARMLPSAHVAVINRGVGGEDAAEELARLERDVVALRPHLVIWQVGANATLRDVEPTAFRATVIAGVRRIHAAGADVILMDSQRSRRILDAPRHAAIEQALADAAQSSDAAVYSRGALMDTWRAEGQDYDRFLAQDGLHHNDFGYRCLAENLAGTIADAVQDRGQRVAASPAATGTGKRAAERSLSAASRQ